MLLIFTTAECNQISAGIMAHTSIYDLCKYSLAKAKHLWAVRHQHREDDRRRRQEHVTALRRSQDIMVSLQPWRNSGDTF